ncbi:hypothetical protein [Maridesulfovibrio sp.]|uniref:hypothetical protein n=1 Tax=Maridesulfovibrio sp. TaxID=2795000 RepID=UPI0029F5B485|nr:hypothetical protein [Maridesulfovibrio sp.]
MFFPNIIVISTVIIVGVFLLFYRPLTESSAWRATITPLASIMGSGFLVCVPLLYTNVGNYAVLAISGLLVLAYGVGAVIRFNIRYSEPLLSGNNCALPVNESRHSRHVAHCQSAQNIKSVGLTSTLEQTSHIVLSVAYCISVSYYLQLMAEFGLNFLSLDSALYGKWVVTITLATIGAIGTARGLKGIEKVERIVVGLNLAMIASLVAGLVHYNAQAILDGTWQLRAIPFPEDSWHTIRLVMGMLIVVQGFEISRFLGHEHSAGERIRTMRIAQVVSSVIYVVFIGLMGVIISRNGQDSNAGVTAIVNYSAVVAPVLPLLLTLTALGSQFSAATADDAGCSGLLESIFKGLIPIKYNYLVVSLFATVITWLTDVYQIINYASRAFALFYVLQCAVAIMTLHKVKPSPVPLAKGLLFGFIGILCLGVTIFGIPAG